MSLGFDVRDKRVWVAGHLGMLGASLVRRLVSENCEVLTVARSELDLRDQSSVRNWMERARPTVVILAAGKVGGILANQRAPADFIYDNLAIAANVIEGAFRFDVEKLLYLGSSAAYPRFAEQPMREGLLHSGPLEPAHESYAIAKLAGIKLVQSYRQQHGCDYISCLPSNLYGPGDNFDLTYGHVVPSLIRRVHEAKLCGDPEVTIWGSGTARREILHVDDCADACVHLLKKFSGSVPVNVGSGTDVTILELTQTICKVVGFTGALRHDITKPDGQPRRLMCSESLRRLGWAPSIQLQVGLEHTYRWFLKNCERMSR